MESQALADAGSQVLVASSCSHSASVKLQGLEPAICVEEGSEEFQGLVRWIEISVRVSFSWETVPHRRGRRRPVGRNWLTSVSGRVA